ENNCFNDNYYLPMGDNYFGSELFNTPNINESFISEILNTMSEVSNVTKISDTISETSNNFDIIDETSNASSSSRSDIWKFFDKKKKDKTITTKYKHCLNVRYSIIKGTTTNLWTHVKRIVLEDLSFTIVEGQIKSIIEKISKFHVVSADTIKRDIIKKYKKMQTSVQIELQVIPGKFAVSLDMWTLIAVKAYIRIIAHYIDKDWQLQQKTLDFVEVEGSHTGTNLANKVINKLKDETEKIRNLITKFRSSPQQRKKFSEIANLNNINLLLILDVPTRWNSTYMMIQRALSLKVVFDKILLIEEFSDLSDFKLSQSEWISLENIAIFLKRFAKLSTEMCFSTYPTINAAKAAWEKLQEYYNKTLESYHYISTILDPCWKIKYFQTWANDNYDQVYYKDYRSLYFPISSSVSNNLQNEDDDEDLLFPVPKHFRNHDGHDELNTYLDSSLEPSEINVLDYTPVERLFSKSGNVITPERNRLESGTIQAIMCLKISKLMEEQDLNQEINEIIDSYNLLINIDYNHIVAQINNLIEALLRLNLDDKEKSSNSKVIVERKDNNSKTDKMDTYHIINSPLENQLIRNYLKN
ncbi:846_t:CDS:2, partial [Dentiscutata erythropus]